MQKKCSRCKIEKDIDCFSLNKAKKSGRQTTCKECQKNYSNQHYQKNKSIYIERASKKKKEIRKWWKEYKKQFKCACGESHPACIDFHHPDNNKEKDVSTLFNEGAVKKGLEEIEKCIPVCANCHRKIHAKIINDKILNKS